MSALSAINYEGDFRPEFRLTIFSFLMINCLEVSSRDLIHIKKPYKLYC